MLPCLALFLEAENITAICIKSEPKGGSLCAVTGGSVSTVKGGSVWGVIYNYDCWDMLIEVEIEPIIPPRENAMYQLDGDGQATNHPRNRALEVIDEGGVEHNRKGWKIQSGYHRRSKSENAFFRWKTILGEKMYAREFENQKTEAAVKAAILNKFIQIAAPKAVKVA